MEIRVHNLERLTSMTLARVKAHFNKALTMLFNIEKFDQGFETLNFTMIEQLNKMLNDQSATGDAKLIKYSIFLLTTASYSIRSTLVRNFIANKNL
jgi:hypothetical protein